MLGLDSSTRIPRDSLLINDHNIDPKMPSLAKLSTVAKAVVVKQNVRKEKPLFQQTVRTSVRSNIFETLGHFFFAANLYSPHPQKKKIGRSPTVTYEGRRCIGRTS